MRNANGIGCTFKNRIGRKVQVMAKVLAEAIKGSSFEANGSHTDTA
tara:strand:- start:426 stop:563 length:138 start_codon:yes stop_codon:yes gene_type:complete